MERSPQNGMLVVVSEWIPPDEYMGKQGGMVSLLKIKKDVVLLG
ncbi:MAG: hypothetical protein HW407_1765, partial [Bacteroidetes bacterium]|nr:hypothetical protein [Bacteroidota bacterium]